MTAKYIPEPAPEEWSSEYIARELQRVSDLLSDLLEGFIEITYVAPVKPRDGMLRLADGTRWDPGIGRGLYRYDSTAAKWIPYG